MTVLMIMKFKVFYITHTTIRIKAFYFKRSNMFVVSHPIYVLLKWYLKNFSFLIHKKID